MSQLNYNCCSLDLFIDGIHNEEGKVTSIHILLEAFDQVAPDQDDNVG